MKSLDVEEDWFDLTRQVQNLPHPDSPAGKRFDWFSAELSHSDSPAGAAFDWYAILPSAEDPLGEVRPLDRSPPGIERRPSPT